MKKLKVLIPVVIDIDENGKATAEVLECFDASRLTKKDMKSLEDKGDGCGCSIRFYWVEVELEPPPGSLKSQAKKIKGKLCG